MADAPSRINDHTLLCERCGYIIEGLPETGACPECGRPIAESLPERRDLTVATGWLGSVYRNAARTIRHPFRTLDRTPIHENVIHAGLWTRIHAATWIGASLAVSSIALGVLDDNEPYGLAIGLAVMMIIGLVGGTLVFLLIQLLTWIEVRGLVLFGKQRGSRITLNVARTTCAHGSAGWLIASIGFALTATTASLTWGLFAGWKQHDGYRSPTLPGWGWAVVETSPLVALAWIAIGFLFFETFAWLGLRRLRFANPPRPMSG